MAAKNITGTTPVQAAALPAANPAKPKPLFKPFSWTEHTSVPGILEMPSHRVLSAASTVRDLTNGITVVMEMLERDLLDAACYDEDDELHTPPLLGGFEQGALLRMAITASKIAAREVETLTDWVMEHGERQKARSAA